MIKNKKILLFLLYFFIAINIHSNKCYAHSKEYYLGYVQSIIDEIIPQKNTRINLDKGALHITIEGGLQDLDTQQTLLAKLKKTKLFKTVKLSFPDKVMPVNAAKADRNSQTVYEALPSGTIYDSPVADPKWPKFSAGYQVHFKDRFGKRAFNLAFGENLALVRVKNDSSVYEFGIQAGLTGLMNISSQPTRLINSDYFVGIGLSMVHAQRWQNLIQFSHLSSHIGDELLITKPSLAQERINLSYETLKWFTAYKFNSLRPYIALAYMVSRDPSYIRPFSFEVGCDYLSENKFLFETTRYVFGIHAHSWQENKYKPSFSIRTGLQLENPIWRGRNLQFLLDYFNGNSRHGQFYTKKEHYIGILISLAT